MTKIIHQIRNDLIQSADEKTKSTAQRFFKEKIKFHGVNLWTVNKVSKEKFKEIKNLSKKEIFDLCGELLKSGYSEESWIAANWAYYIRDKFKPEDFEIFEDWIEKYINNWASCDTLCNHTVGDFVEQYPEFISRLKKWAKSNNRWVKRASAVTLILPARKGKFLNDIFEIADTLLLDQDDLVQKGYGWMLKEASKLHQKEVFDYVIRHKDKMPRTALRYAIEKMPEKLRKQAMGK